LSPRVAVEPRTYGPDSPNSYFLDRLSAMDNFQAVDGAEQRMARYAAEVGHEIRSGSPEGRRAEKVLREVTRVSDQRAHEQRFAEARAVTTAGGITASAPAGAAAFVTPMVFTDMYAGYRTQGRGFAGQCNNVPLAPYGLEAYIPQITAGVGGGGQVEGNAVNEADPSTGLLKGAVEMVSGEVTISQQIFDHTRGGDYGYQFDVVLY